MTAVEGWIERDGVPLHVVEWPGHGPAIFALHGLSSNARFWSRVAGHLDGRRFVALDQRSHGPSAPSGEGDDLTTFVEDAAYAIETLGLSRPVVVGHSWGAAVALELAARRSDRVSALAFIDGAAWPLSDAMPWETFAARTNTPLPRYPDLAAAVASARAALGDAWGDDLVEFVRAGHVERDGALVLPLTSDARARIVRDLFVLRQDLAWSALGMPAVAAFAERKSELMLAATRRAVARVAAVAPQVRIKWYDAPHDIPLHLAREIAEDLAGL